MTNRADIRTEQRDILREFYLSDTVGTAAIDGSSTTLPINDISLYSVGVILQIESEHMLVKTVDNTNGVLTVIRGYEETTAAAHSAAAKIILRQEYSDRALNLTINLAIGDTFDGQNGIWIDTVDETLDTSISTREYTIPSGLTDISRIQLQDGNGNFQGARGWQLIGTKIQFQYDFGTAGKTIRVIGTTFQSLINDDATVFDLSDEQLQFVIYDATWHAIQQRYGQRLRTVSYPAAVNERAGQPVELLQMASNLRRTVEMLKKREFKPRRVTYAPFAKR